MHTARAVFAALALSACATSHTENPERARASAPAPDNALASAISAELDRLAKDPTTREAVVVAVDPRTGAVLATGGRANGADAPDLARTRVYPSGSVAKVFTVAAALEAGVATTESVSGADYKIGSLAIEGNAKHPTLSIEDVLVFSSNVGAARVYEKLGKTRLHDALVALGFEPGDAASWNDETATKIAYGAGLRATAVQYAQAFGSIASARRVVSPAHATQLLRMMEGVVHRDDGTGTGARVDGVRVTGKTGTATFDEDNTTFAAFVGAVPADAPKLVVYVGVKTAARGYTGGTVAAPAFARIVASGLKRD